MREGLCEMRKRGINEVAPRFGIDPNESGGVDGQSRFSPIEAWHTDTVVDIITFVEGGVRKSAR